VIFREKLVREKEENLCSEEKNVLKSAILMQSRSRMKIGGVVMSG